MLWANWQHENHSVGKDGRNRNKLVKLGVVFYLISPSHVSIPKNQNGTMTKDALLIEMFCSAECVRYIRQNCKLCGLAACASSAGHNRTLIEQHDLAAANG